MLSICVYIRFMCKLYIYASLYKYITAIIYLKGSILLLLSGILCGFSKEYGKHYYSIHTYIYINMYISINSYHSSNEIISTLHM